MTGLNNNNLENSELVEDKKLNKFENETSFEWKLRLTQMKLNKEIDLDWSEIVSLLGLTVSADHLRKVSYGYSEYHEYLHNKDGVATTILSISDTHVPFQHDVEKLKDYIGVDILQINGDFCDMQSLSTFPKAYRVPVMEEIIQGRQYMIDLIEFVKPKKVIVTYGNHDSRYGSYLAKHLDSDIVELQPNTALELIIELGFPYFDKRRGVKTHYAPLKDVYTDVEIIYANNWHCQIGDAIFCHPKAFASNPMKTAEKAMLWFRNEGYTFKQLIMAHTHRSGRYNIGNTTLIEQGAFCKTKMNDYADGKLYNSQKEGFVYLCQDKDGNTIDSKTRLVLLN